MTFAERLAAYKKAIDQDIAEYSTYARQSAQSQFGTYAVVEMDAFLDMLARGGKRIRGALVMLGYEMSGGTNKAMIVQAARAIEMLHAYMLITDDIQDRSSLRRGKPTVNAHFEAFHREHRLRGDPEHTGVSMGINAATAGGHAAQIILANLDADPELRLRVVSITNRTLLVTTHGQTYDIMNELLPEPNVADIDRVLEWKTAQYSFNNPLHVGMVLAGADCHATDAITPYAIHTGRAFQIVDDILGIVGNEEEVGKSPMDDIREGKQTLLMAYALSHAKAGDATFLKDMLGNQHLTVRQFDRCKAIIESSGALAHCRQLAKDEVEQALRVLDDEAGRWPKADMDFLRGLAEQMIKRNT